MEQQVKKLLKQWFVHNSLKPMKIMPTLTEAKEAAEKPSLYYESLYEEIYDNIYFHRPFVANSKTNSPTFYADDAYLYYKREDGTYKNVVSSIKEDFYPITCMNYYYFTEKFNQGEIYSMQQYYLQWENVKYETFPHLNLVVFYITIDKGLSFGNIKNASILTFVNYDFEVNQFLPQFEISVENLKYLIH